MKKLITIVLVLLMVFSLFACSGNNNANKNNNNQNNQTDDNGTNGDSSDNSSSPTPDMAATPNMNEDGTPNLDRIAHYDRNYDYTQNERFKVMYLASSGSILYQMSADAYKHWAPMFNCEWMNFQSSEGDNDMYMTLLQTNLDQGVRGFILDPDATIFGTVIEKLEDYPDAQWMSQMAPPRDGVTVEGGPIGGELIHPYVGFDNYNVGIVTTEKLIEWKNENLADVSWDDIGLISMTFSTSPPLAEREIGARYAFEAGGGNMDNYFVADCVSGGMTLQGAIDTVSPIITTHGELKNWLVFGLFDDFAQAAATVLDQVGLTEGSCVTAFGGSGWINQTDGGQHDAFRYACFTAQTLYGEPIFGAMYAFLMGWATPDTIWPSWVKEGDHGGGDHTYSQLLLPTCWLEADSYKEYLEWTDWYTGADAYHYDVEVTGDEYSPFMEIPDEGYIKN